MILMKIVIVSNDDGKDDKAGDDKNDKDDNDRAGGNM